MGDFQICISVPSRSTFFLYKNTFKNCRFLDFFKTVPTNRKDIFKFDILSFLSLNT